MDHLGMRATGREILRLDDGRACRDASEYRLADNVLLLLAPDGTARLLDLGGKFHALSETATLMLRETLANGTGEAALSVATRYLIDAAVAQRDMAGFLGRLERQGLISRHGSAGPRATFCSAVVRRALQKLLRVTLTRQCSAPARVRALLGISYFAIKCLGWPTAVADFQLVSRNRAPRGVDAGPTLAELDDMIRTEAARALLPLECKERALACWTLLRWLGLPAKLVVGVALYPMAGHCWCELDAQVLGDSSDRCNSYTAVTAYD